MMSGDFQAKLRKLNSNLRIFCGDDSRRSAGLFHVLRGEYTEVCGVDKNEVPKYTIIESTGRIVKSGWYRTVRILIDKGLADRWKAQRVFGTYFDRRPIGRLPKRVLNLEKVAEKAASLGMSVVERSQ